MRSIKLHYAYLLTYSGLTDSADIGKGIQWRRQ